MVITLRVKEGMPFYFQKSLKKINGLHARPRNFHRPISLWYGIIIHI